MRILSTIVALAMLPLSMLSQEVEPITLLFHYKQSVVRDIRAFVVQDSIYVDVQQVASFIMGTCTIGDNVVSIDLDGALVRADFRIEECIVRDSSIAIAVGAFSRLPGIRATVSFNDLSVWLYSDQPLAIDAVDESWLRHLHRQNINVQDQVPNMIVPMDRTLVGGGSLIYDVGTNSTQLGTSVSANVSTGMLIAGGDLNMALAAAVSPFNAPQLQARGGWFVGQPNSKWWTSLGIGVIRNEHQWAPLLYGAVISNSPLGVERSFGTDSTEVLVSPGANVDVLVNGSYRSSHLADEAGRVVIPVRVNYGTTSVELEVFEKGGKVIKQPLRFRIDDASVSYQRLQYTTSIGYSPEFAAAEGHTVVGYGLTPDVTIAAMADAACDIRGLLWHHVGVSATARLGTASLLSASYTPSIAARITATLSVTPSFQLQADYTSFMRDAWSSGTRIGIQPPSSTTIDAAHLELTASANLGLPLSLTSVYEGRRHADLRIAQALRWNLSYSSSLARIAIRSRHDKNVGPIDSYTESSIWMRYPTDAWASELLENVQVGIEGGTAWSAFQPWWRYTIEKRLRFGMLQQTFGITRSTTTPTTFYARAEIRLPGVQAQISGAMEGSQSTVRTSMTGGVRLDDDTWDVEFARQMRASTSAVVLVCFEDANRNGQYEDNERIVPDVGITNSFGVRHRHPTGGLLITDLIANAEYTFTLDRSTIDDPYVKLTADVISVTTEPYHTTAVYVPMRAVSVLEGSIASTRPRAGVIVTITDARGRSETSTTFSDGSFVFNGIDAGTYTIRATGGSPTQIEVSEVASTMRVELRMEE